MSANGSEALFDIIQKELNKIVERGEQLQPTSGNTKKGLNEKPAAKEDNAAGMGTSRRISAGSERSMENLHIPTLKPSEIDQQLNEMSRKYKTTLERDIEAQAAALESPRTKCIDADLQKMQMELQETYNAFQSISQKFEAIDFTRLHKRIKDLNLATKRDAVGHERSDELKKAVDEGFQNNRFEDLTQEMGEKFRKHPGEFGNIPELSSFFQACTQLEHCLGNLKRQRNDVHDLDERMRHATEVSLNRTNYIKQQLAEDKDDFDPKDFE